MREITIAKGQLRCGECHQVFNATKTLSTTVPDRFERSNVEAPEDLLIDNDHPSVNDIKRSTNDSVVIGDESNKLSSSVKNYLQNANSQFEKIETVIKHDSTKSKSQLSTLLFVSFLFLLLVTQILYNYRHIIFNIPRHEPEKIQMLNHNVFVHPNEIGVLLITATIKNTAKHSQAYPILELSLSNAQSTIIALRRFKPEEYLDSYNEDMLLNSKEVTSLKLKIKDPGNKATRFQFDFL